MVHTVISNESISSRIQPDPFLSYLSILSVICSSACFQISSPQEWNDITGFVWNTAGGSVTMFGLSAFANLALSARYPLKI